MTQPPTPRLLSHQYEVQIHTYEFNETRQHIYYLFSCVT
jgi:hypothetical protein